MTARVRRAAFGVVVAGGSSGGDGLGRPGRSAEEVHEGRPGPRAGGCRSGSPTSRRRLEGGADEEDQGVRAPAARPTTRISPTCRDRRLRLTRLRQARRLVRLLVDRRVQDGGDGEGRVRARRQPAFPTASAELFKKGAGRRRGSFSSAPLKFPTLGDHRSRTASVASVKTATAACPASIDFILFNKGAHRHRAHLLRDRPGPLPTSARAAAFAFVASRADRLLGARPPPDPAIASAILAASATLVPVRPSLLDRARLKTTLKRGIGRGAASTDGNGHAVLPPAALTPMTRYRAPSRRAARASASSGGSCSGSLVVP